MESNDLKNESELPQHLVDTAITANAVCLELFQCNNSSAASETASNSISAHAQLSSLNEAIGSADIE